MKLAVLFLSSLFISSELFATQVQYSGKTISLSPVTCRELHDEDGRNVQLRVEAGYFNRTVGERLELVFNVSAEMKSKGEGEIHLADPEKEGTVCLRSMDDSQPSMPLKTFCIARTKGDDSCDVKYIYANNKFKASLSCKNLRRASNPKLPEQMNLVVPESHPVECEIKSEPVPTGPVVKR